MKITKLETREQIENLKKGSFVLVQWQDKISAGRVHAVLDRMGEIVVHRKGNLYFNIDKYLEGTSVAKEVYLVEEA